MPWNTPKKFQFYIKHTDGAEGGFLTNGSSSSELSLASSSDDSERKCQTVI
jgi:hypothetical protein